MKNKHKESVTLDDILRDHQSRLALGDFCQKTYSAENLNFLHACDELMNANETEANEYYQKILETYVVTKAPCEINLSGDVKEACLEHQQASLDQKKAVLDKAKAEIYLLIQLDVFQRFIQSPAFERLSKKEKSNSFLYVTGKRIHNLFRCKSSPSEKEPTSKRRLH